MCTEKSSVSDVDWGLLEYHAALDRQIELFQSLIATQGTDAAREYLVTVEHPHVYTLGKHANKDNILRRLPGVDIIQITRGGDITYHGPGQLVAYPIIDLRKHHLGVKSYIDLLEESVIRTIWYYGVRGERVEGATGVWIDRGTPRERKICAIGVKCSRFCTMHGLALNVNTDLNYFSAINPCGFVDKGVTSLAAELGHQLDFEEVKTIFRQHFHSLLDSHRRNA